MRTTEPDTMYVTSGDLKKSFHVTQAWKKLWPNVEYLYWSFLMKELVISNTITGHNGKIQED